MYQDDKLITFPVFLKIVNAQFLFAARKDSLNIHHLGSIFTCVYDTFFMLTSWKQNVEVSPQVFDLCSV